MSTCLRVLMLGVFLCSPGFLRSAYGSIELEEIGSFRTGVFDESAAEISAYDPITQLLFVTNGNSKTIDTLDLSDPKNPTLLNSEPNRSWHVYCRHRSKLHS